MNEMQIFQNEKFGQVRVIERDGEPWFVGKDIADKLGYSNTRDALLRHVDSEDKGTSRFTTPYGEQDMTIINESGIYSLVLRSKLPDARQFKRWITHEVIPSIRKTGGYIAGSENMTNEELMAKALIVAQNTINQREERIKALEASKANLESKIEADKPKVEFAEALTTSTNSITIKQFSVLLCQKGYNTGEKRMFQEFRTDGFLLTHGNYYNEPAQRFMDMKLFEVKTGTYTVATGETYNSRQTLITPKGIQYFMDYYMRKHGMMPMLTTARR